MRAEILGVNVDRLTMAETVERISQAVKGRSRIRVVTANPEVIYAAGRNAELKKLINSADIVTADGVGVVWAARRLGVPVAERVTGIDLLCALFPVAQAGKWRIFFLGGKPGVAEEAALRVCRDYGEITWAARHGYFSPEEERSVIAQIEGFQPDILLAGLGSPRQEYWLEEHSGLATVCIGVGGSFDVLAGMVLRAPENMRALHLEWLYRLWQEPRRWKRQIVLPVYVLKVFWQSLRRKA